MASTTVWLFKKIVKEQSGLKICFYILWPVHILLSLTLLSYVSFSRLLHLFSSPLNMFFRNLEAKGALPMLGLEASENYGVGRIEEFTWKHLLELDACTFI
jgi:hypothetical protein